MAVAVPVGMATLPSRPTAPAPDPILLRRRPAPPPSPVLPDPGPAASPDPAPSAPPKRPATAWIKVQLDFPQAPGGYQFTAVVLAANAEVDASFEEANVDRFTLGPVPPGRKTVLLFSRGGEFAPVAAATEVADRGEATVVLRPALPIPIEGVVVDANGTGVPGIDVEFSVLLPVGGPPEADPDRVYHGLGGGGARSGGRFRRSSRHRFSVLWGSKGITVIQSRDTDEDGKFQLNVYGAGEPVRLTLRAGPTGIKEESILPARSPFRLLIPTPLDRPQ